MAKSLGAELPPGFVLDEPQSYGAALPPGFVLDEPTQETQTAETAAEPELSTTDKLVIGAGRGFTNVAEGVEQVARETAAGTTGDLEAAAEGDLIDQFIAGGKFAQNPIQAAIAVFNRISGNDAESQQKALAEFNKQVSAERQYFDETEAGKSTASKIGEVAGEVAPALVVPGGVAGGLAKQMATGAAAGAGLGASAFVEDGQSRAQNAATGAAFGAAGPVVGKVAKEVVAKPAKAVADKLKPLFGRTSDDLVQELAGETLEPGTQKALRAARKLGDNLTPAEASGRSRLAAKQGKLGVTDETANLAEDALRKRADFQAVKVHDFLTQVSGSSKSASAQVRNAAKGVIKDLEAVRAKAAKPFYQEAYTKSVEPGKLGELFDDPVLSEALESVSNSSIWQKRLKDVPTNSVEYLHVVKQALDDKIGALYKAGSNQEASIALDSKHALTKLIEEVAPEYKTANQIYAAGSRAVEGLNESTIGKISQLPDLQLKNVSKVVFDSTETNPATRNKLRLLLTKKDPEAWNRLLRNEFERRLDQTKKSVNGSTFYDAILSRPKDFKMFMDAARGMPEVRRKLLWMKRSWKDLINPETVKGSASKAKSSLDVPRSSAELAINAAKELAGSKQDMASLRLIFSNKWDGEVLRIMRTRGAAEQSRGFAALLGKVAAAESSELQE